MTTVKVTFVLVTYGHIRNIPAVYDPMLTKLFGPNFLRALIFVDQLFFGTQPFFYPIIFLDPKNLLPKTGGPKTVWTQILFTQNILSLKKFLDLHFLGPKIFRTPTFFQHHFSFTSNFVNPICGPTFICTNLMSIWLNLYLQSNCLSLDSAPAQLQLIEVEVMLGFRQKCRSVSSPKHTYMFLSNNYLLQNFFTLAT